MDIRYRKLLFENWDWTQKSKVKWGGVGKNNLFDVFYYFSFCLFKYGV